MELVRAYVKKGFQTIQTIKPKDVDIIVDRYLQGEDMSTIAREEAKRIWTLAHTSDDELEDAYDIEQSLRRPPLRDSNVPEGYERQGVLIVPQRPNPFSPRIEGQRLNETFEQAETRLNKESKIMTTLVTVGLSLIGIAIIVTVLIQVFK